MESDIIKQEIIQKGAEATLFRGKWFEKDVIFKQRIAKKYRIEQLDSIIRTRRTLNEARALVKVKTYGVNCPQVYDVDQTTSTIVMKFIPGKKIKDLMDSLEDEKLENYCKTIGKFIAKLHLNGHIHGDITTSNIIITPEEKIFLIDFGLHDYSDTIEDKSVDLHLFKRVLQSSHGNLHEMCFQAFLEGYKTEYRINDLNNAEEIINNIFVIETRGRYVKKQDRK